MGDSNFHIVQKSDGQFEIVKLPSIFKKIVHPKIGTETVDNPEVDCKKQTEEREYPRSLKTYSRIRKEVCRFENLNLSKL